MNIQASQSEDSGTALLADNDQQIYSVGISIGGVAEIRMAQGNPGRHIVVVRSVNCPDAKDPRARYNSETGLTTCAHTNDQTGETHTSVRYFHSEESIREHVAKAGFIVEYTKSYNERLFIDFMRTKLAPHDDNVVELVATK